MGHWDQPVLTDLICRKARGREADYKIFDEKGLYLFVTKAGFRSWRLKYRFEGKERRLVLGPYPEVTLVAARDQRDDVRRLLRGGIDPAADRKERAAKADADREAARTFRDGALAWHQAQLARWKPRYAGQILDRLEADVFPAIGATPIREITPARVLEIIRSIEARGSIEMAHRVRGHVSDVFVFGISSGWAEQDPAAVIRKAQQPVARGRRPAVTTIDAARQVLVRTEAEPAYAVTKLAARLLALTAARPGVVRLAEPSEFEGLGSAEPIWRIPAEKMKLTRERRADLAYEFVIPLSRQAVEVVQTALAIAGAGAKLLFPSVKHAHRPMSDSTLSKLYRDAGYRDLHVPHGWRATFSTSMNREAALADRASDREVVDLMLAHVPAGVEPIYNRYMYLPRRRAIAQRWADALLDGLPAPNSLIDGQRGSSARATRARSRDRRLREPAAPAAKIMAETA